MFRVETADEILSQAASPATVRVGAGPRRRAWRSALGGRRYTLRKAALNRRMLPNPAAKATAVIGIAVSSTSA